MVCRASDHYGVHVTHEGPGSFDPDPEFVTLRVRRAREVRPRVIARFYTANLLVINHVAGTSERTYDAHASLS